MFMPYWIVFVGRKPGPKVMDFSADIVRNYMYDDFYIGL